MPDRTHRKAIHHALDAITTPPPFHPVRTDPDAKGRMAELVEKFLDDVMLYQHGGGPENEKNYGISNEWQRERERFKTLYSSTHNEWQAGLKKHGAAFARGTPSLCKRFADVHELFITSLVALDWKQALGEIAGEVVYVLRCLDQQLDTIAQGENAKIPSILSFKDKPPTLWS